MKVLLLNPPFLKEFSRPQRSPAVTMSGTFYFPVGLAYAAYVLDENGLDVDLVDAPADGYSIDDIIVRTKRFQPSLVILDTSTPSIYNDVTFAVQLKELFPSSFIILIGTHVSALPEETLNEYEKI